MRRNMEFLGVFNVWSLILFYLDTNDLTFMSACSKSFEAWFTRNEAIRDLRWRKKYPMDQEIHRKIKKNTSEFLPRSLLRFGTQCTFVYKRAAFDNNPEACLRALAMAAVYRIRYIPKFQDIRRSV